MRYYSFKINEMKKINPEFIWLFCCSCFCVALSFYRIYFTQKTFFIFLNWNLFLAAVPLIVSSFLVSNDLLFKSKIAFALSLMVWILFFPNSPYIFTDLFHIKARKIIPIWYDLVLILSFAFTGLMMGFVSLRQLLKVAAQYFSQTFINVCVVLLFFISSYGIYLGRFLRWNSWDIINEPTRLIGDMSDHLTNPSENAPIWAMTVIMGIFLNMIYWSYKVIKLS